MERGLGMVQGKASAMRVSWRWGAVGSHAVEVRRRAGGCDAMKGKIRDRSANSASVCCLAEFTRDGGKAEAPGHASWPCTLSGRRWARQLGLWQLRVGPPSGRELPCCCWSLGEEETRARNGLGACFTQGGPLLGLDLRGAVWALQLAWL